MDVAPLPTANQSASGESTFCADESTNKTSVTSPRASRRRQGAFGLEDLLAAPPEKRAFSPVFKFWMSFVAGLAYVALEIAIHMKCGISEEVLKKEGTAWPGCPFSPVGKGVIAFMEVICNSGRAGIIMIRHVEHVS